MKTALIAACAATLLLLSACNTVKGVGEGACLAIAAERDANGERSYPAEQVERLRLHCS